MEEREADRRRAGAHGTIGDPEKVREQESLKLARAELTRQAGATTHPVRKKQIAEEVNRLFATECYNLWTSYSTWAVPTQPGVHGPTTFALPDGSMAEFGGGIGGNFSLMNMWVDR